MSSNLMAAMYGCMNSVAVTCCKHGFCFMRVTGNVNLEGCLSRNIFTNKFLSHMTYCVSLRFCFQVITDYHKGIIMTKYLPINPFPNKPWFLHVYNASLLKTLWEQEKLLIMSNFSFSHSVYYPFGELICHFYQI